MSEPFLRPAPPEGAPPFECPDGHTAEAAGSWYGCAMEVVYDQSRHDVAFVRECSLDVAAALRATGWELRRTHETNQMWIRDRAAHARRRLELVRPDLACRRIA